MGYPSVYPTGVTLYDPSKAWSGYTLFQAAGLPRPFAAPLPSGSAGDRARQKRGYRLGVVRTPRVRRGHWKAVHIPGPFGTNEWQLYDLKADPGETRDLARERADKLVELLSDWDVYARETGVVWEPAPFSPLLDPPPSR